MTRNQIEFAKAEEAGRSNRAREEETRRHNKYGEKLDTVGAVTDVIGAVTGIGKLGGLRKRGGNVTNITNNKNYKDSGNRRGKKDLNTSWADRNKGKKNENDPSWYNLNSALVRDVASISYNAPLGGPAMLPSRNAEKGFLKEAIPSMMALSFVSSIGISSNSEATPANIAAKNIYAFVRHANSGSSNYDAPDLMLYLLAQDSAYMYYTTLVRLYSALVNGDANNWSLPAGYVSAMNCDYNDLNQHIAELRYWINSYAQRLSIFNVPNKFPFYQRHMWMCLNVFKDNQVKRSQTYFFLPAVLHTYSDTKGKLKTIDFLGQSKLGQEHKYTYSEIVKVGETIITNLISSEDINIMSGDILKAYGAENMLKLDMIDEHIQFNPIYSEEVLQQINNATLLGDVDNIEMFEFNQTSKTGFIAQGQKVGDRIVVPRFVGWNAIQTTTSVTDGFPNIGAVTINMLKDDPTPDDNMVASRLCASLEWSPQGEEGAKTYSFYQQVVTCGSEMLLFANMSKIDISGSGYITVSQPIWRNMSIGKTQTANDFQGLMRTFGDYAAFDWAPVIYLDLRSANADKIEATRLWTNFDVNNYAVLYYNNLTAMHAVALQSQFAIPLLGNTVKNFRAQGSRR